LTAVLLLWARLPRGGQPNRVQPAVEPTTAAHFSPRHPEARLPDDTLFVRRGGAAAEVSVTRSPETVVISRTEAVAALRVTIVGRAGDFPISSNDFAVRQAEGAGGDRHPGRDVRLSLYLPDSSSAQAAIDSVCAGVPGTFPATVTPPGLVLPSELRTAAGASTTICLPFSYRLGHDPLTVLLKGTPISWTLPAANRGSAASTTTRSLARYTGSGNQLLAVPTAITSAHRVDVGWTLRDPGNNIIGTESDSVGNNLRIITDGLGPDEASLALTLNGSYLQVISQGKWSITIAEPAGRGAQRVNRVSREWQAS
jgi:hypothetical protein